MAQESSILTELKKLVGKEMEITGPEEVGRAGIRYFAQAIGDMNPLFSDEEYGKATRWGSVIAPPTFLFTCEGIGAPRGLGGVHAMWSGASFEMEDVLREGTGIRGTVTPSGLTPKETRFASAAILQEFTYAFLTVEGRDIGN